MKSHKIIGIAGTNGSGKDIVSEVLANDYGWTFISASGDLLIPELKRRGLPLERQQMADLSTEWRKEIGMGAVVVKAVEEYQRRAKNRELGGLVISSLRHPGEADRVHELGGKVVWVDADPKIRYERINSRGQGGKDRKTYEQFLAEEQAEMEHSGDEATLNIAGVKAKADIFIENNGTLEEFKKTIQEKLNLA
ncbi:MAG TPA: AAA family ATPase [Candidatus Saccharimonadales bacterium]|nr:AAA family ATPase [Candidatus Saccharimonadales bacterium]